MKAWAENGTPAVGLGLLKEGFANGDTAAAPGTVSVWCGRIGAPPAYEREAHATHYADQRRIVDMVPESTLRMTPAQVAELTALAALPEDAIDTSDAPEVTDWSGAKRGLFYTAAATRK